MNKEQYERYSRHLLLDRIGVAGQEKLLAAKVLLIGAGGLGSPSALYLAAAGVGTLGIVDFDVVDLTNLQRQVLHSTSFLGKSKLESARTHIAELNPDINVVCHETRLTSANAMEIFAGYDIIVDGCDNFATRYLSNDACVFLKKPNIYGSIYQFEGQATTFIPGKGPCYRCLFPEPPPPGTVPSCAEGGVLGILPGMIGMIQATETVKLILDQGTSLAGRLLLYDAWEMEFRTVRVRRNPECPVCGDNPTIKQLIDYELFCGVGSHSDNANGDAGMEISVEELKERLAQEKDAVLVDVRNPHEYEAGHIEGAHLLPLPELDQRMAELDQYGGKNVYVYCQKGGRSAQACGKMRSAGHENVINVRGGFSEWSRLA